MSESTVSNEFVDASEEMQDAEDWGDSGDVSGTLSETPPSAETPEMFLPQGAFERGESIPEELCEPVSLNGLRLLCCPNVWNMEAWAVKLRKNLSITFSFDGDITKEDILDSFEQARFDTEKVVSIQWLISNRMWTAFLSRQRKTE